MLRMIALLSLVILLMGFKPTWAMDNNSIERIKTFLGYYELENPELSPKGCLSGIVELGGDAPNFTLNFSGTPLIALFSSDPEEVETGTKCKDQLRTSFSDDKIDYFSTSTLSCSKKPKVAQTTIFLKFQKDAISYTQSTSQTGSAIHTIECKLVKRERPSQGKLDPD